MKQFFELVENNRAKRALIIELDVSSNTVNSASGSINDVMRNTGGRRSSKSYPNFEKAEKAYQKKITE